MKTYRKPIFASIIFFNRFIGYLSAYWEIANFFPILEKKKNKCSLYFCRKWINFKKKRWPDRKTSFMSKSNPVFCYQQNCWRVSENFWIVWPTEDLSSPPLCSPIEVIPHICNIQATNDSALQHTKSTMGNIKKRENLQQLNWKFSS